MSSYHLVTSLLMMLISHRHFWMAKTQDPRNSLPCYKWDRHGLPSIDSVGRYILMLNPWLKVVRQGVISVFWKAQYGKWPTINGWYQFNTLQLYCRFQYFCEGYFFSDLVVYCTLIYCYLGAHWQFNIFLYFWKPFIVTGTALSLS